MMFITLQAAMKEPLLSLAEERAALRAWQGAGDRGALELLIRSHARQVYAQAARWSDNPAHLEDLVAEGFIGLMRAADNFDLSQEVRFSTYAAWWVLNGVSAAFTRIKTVIDIPARTYFDARTGRLPAEDQLFAQFAMQGMVELDAEMLDGTGPGEALACPDLTPEEATTQRSDKAEQRRLLEVALARLDPQDREVIRRRKLSEPPDSVETVAQALGMTKERLRQVEKRALMRLRRRLIDDGFGLAALS
ncbi:sigma-70 family RNA polymerase sigma factor [Aquicoccus sp. SCR17]|nr:sigma-70 family RNA polymerase sigma factor [Carideicomes alvinocaridis]